METTTAGLFVAHCAGSTHRHLTQTTNLSARLVQLPDVGSCHTAVSGNDESNKPKNLPGNGSLLLRNLFDAFHLHLAGISGRRRCRRMVALGDPIGHGSRVSIFSLSPARKANDTNRRESCDRAPRLVGTPGFFCG